MGRHHGERAHKSSNSHEAENEEQSPRNSSTEMQRQLAIQEMRGLAKEKSTHLYRETVMDALTVVQGMARSEEQSALRQQLQPHVAKAIGGKIIDKIKDKTVDFLGEGVGIASKLSGALLGTFDTIREKVAETVETSEHLTASELMSALVSSSYEAMSAYCTRAEAIIDALPDPFFIDVYREVTAAKKSGPKHLSKALQTKALEKMGLPKTGGALVHSLAKAMFNEWKSGIRSAKPVREQVDEIQHQLQNPAEHAAEVDEKAKQAEEAIGPSMRESVEQDESERAQVDAL